VSAFVLDNSVAMRWLLQSKKTVDQDYSESVLRSLVKTNALVPNLWHLEAANVLLTAEKRHEIKPGDMERFIDQLESLPISVDAMTSQKAFNRTLALAKAFRLSSYDAAYLELAIREGLPLASLDKNLRKATRNAGVDIYLD
jgi:predicted nucleic acid-binding protein